MGLDSYLVDNKTAELSQPSLSKRKSLTRLFSSKKSSRSRASSVEKVRQPPTPSSTDQAHFSPRSPLISQSPAVVSNGSLRSQDSNALDPTSWSQALNNREQIPAASLKGILKSKKQSDSEHVDTKAQDVNTCSSTRRNLVQSLTNTKPHRQRAEKSTIHYSPILSRLQKESRNPTNNPITLPFNMRSRGASTSSHKAPRIQSSPLAGSALQRPSTSGGDCHQRKPRIPISHSEEALGRGLWTEPLPGPVLLNKNNNRGSLHSAITTTSSFIDTSTARSSIITRDTTMSDTTIESPRRDALEEGMTVDEAIGMYENGFDDDAASDQEGPIKSLVSEEERRRSIRIAEAINDSIGSITLPLRRYSTSESYSSAAIFSGDALKSQSPKVPPIMPPTTSRDQYGFLKASRYVSITQYDSWNDSYAPDQDRRTRKWIAFMREQECSTYLPIQFPDRSNKTLRYIRKGIPPTWRGAAWFYYAGGPALLEANPKTYSTLVSRSQTSELSLNDAESIERDLHRTFPDNIHFKPDHPIKPGGETPLLGSLRRVLRAFAIHRPQIGYCQSLNFLTGLLLLFLPEEKAFWLLHVIATTYLPGTHEVSLEGANIDLWVLMIALRESSPTIWAKIGTGGEEPSGIHAARLPPISLCTTSWFMSMFIGTLPVESVLRVWDVVFYEGSKMLFRIALAIFKIGEPRIKEVSDSMELFQVVQALPRGILDIGALMGLACRRGGISQEWVAKKRKERQRWHAKEESTVVDTLLTGKDGTGPQAKRSPELYRSDSVWRRRVGLMI